MTGETQHVYTISDAEAGPKEQDKDFGFEGCGEKDGRAPGGGEGTSPFPATKDKEPHSQREAVIRPQQAGKIDFKSLHNKPKFAGESSWGGIKGSPQSPPGKGRARERSRRAGKGERGQHQLYRLSIASARPSPTIGIAYPQQKVTPPKVPETSRAPAAGSYRFHVPGVPEEEELSFGRCFPEATAGRTSANYTSPPAGPPRPPHGPKGQPPAGIPLKSPGTNGQLHYLEFQANGASSWPSPEKSFAGASYGVKPSSFPEGSKAGGHALGALPFQFPFQLLHDSGKEPYRGDAEYLDVALAAGQAAHGAFGFHASPREWQEETPGIGSFEGACPPGRLYGVPTPLLAPPPAPHRGPLPCYKGRSEHPGDPSGALSSSGAIDQNPSTFQENQAVFPSSLHSPSVPKPVGKGQASAKDSVPSPRLLLPGSPLRRNMPPNSLSQVHFQSKAYCSSPAGSASAGPVPFETSVPTTAPTHPRLVQAWEGAAKAFSPMDQNSAPYSNPVGSQFSFECQPGPEQRQHRQKNARMPWQQIHLASAVPGQNRIELSRQMSGQKLPFPLGTPEWPGSKAHKGPPLNSSPGYHGKKLLSGESLGAQRGDPGLVGAFSFENGKDPTSPACDSRSKALFYSMGQAGPPPPPSRSSSGSALVLPPSALVAASPCGSPLPSPVPNPTCGSTCSSLSPVSSSPLNPSFEDGQLSAALAPSPFFHHPCHPKEGSKTFHPSEVLTSSSLHYHPQDSIKPFHFPPDALKDDHLLKCSPESPFHKAGAEVAKSCLDGLDGEPPPPPPYASHHLLAGSLSSASLDQLDVLLTCKQCDQNYSNLASFLEHRQFCASHPAPHAEAKDPPRVTEGRRGLPPELPKPPTTTGASLPLSPDPQAHLLALNKGEEFLLDGESKSDGKEDALKGGLFNGLAASSLPLTASDLDIDDAKLDSLITEALNGLGYQSDNPEIDSSFIDVFADEELTGMKAAGSGASHKAKEALASESKPRHAAAEEKEGYCDEDSHTAGERAKRRAGKQHGHKGRAARRLVAREAERTEPAAEERTARLRVGRKNSVPPVSSRSASGQKQPKKHSQEPQMKSEAGQGAATKSSKPPRFSMKEGKKRKPRSGTWSKELIHKIVQQKNKLHQLHAKSSKQAQPPLHHERLEPPSQEGRLQEYDYVSDSEDEGAASSRLRGRRKRGAAFMGRAKYSFSKKRPGRGERAKEKDPAWSYSRRRDRQKREAPGHRRVSSPEAAKKGDCAGRARRRSSQSSTGSNPSASVATEVGPTDLVGEKAAVMGRRRSGSPARTPRAALGHPEDRSPKKSQKSKEDVPRGTRQVGSAKPLLASPRSHPSTAPDASAGDDAKEEPLPPSQEGQLPSTATSGRSPIRLPHKKEAEEPKGAANQAGEGSPEAQDSAGLAMVGQRQQFAPYTGDTVKYHAEELMAPSRSEPSPSSTSAAFSGAGSKYGKAHGVADSGKGFATPGAPFGGDAVGMMLAAKAPDPYVGSDSAFFDPKALPAHYDANLFSKPPALGSSHMDEMYLCREDIGTSSFEQKHASISPYTAETPQTKVSSPLSFDSSSIFGELPVTEFDSPLYESVSAGKDGYVAAFACPSSAPSKPLPFEQPYPPFMPEKDWSLMEEVAPMLPEDMAHFHGLAVDKPLAKKFPEEGAVPPAQLPLPLPDRMTDYNVAFINNMSDDELEIKRLVTELESQLQTSKLSGEAPTTLPKGEHHAAPLRGSAAEPFPPLPADQGHQKGLFMADELGSSSLLATKVCAGERLGGEKPAVTGARGGYEGGREPWHGPAAAFGSLDAGMCTPPPSGGFCPKESGEQLQGAVATEGSGPRRMENEPSSKSPPNPCAPDTAEVPIYTDPPPKSPPAVPNARMVEATEANKDTLPSLPCKQGAESFPVPGKPGERFGDATELEKFDAHLPNHNPELGFQPGPATAMDLPFSPHVREVPDAEERPFGKSKEPQMVKSALDFKGDGRGSALLEEAEERKSPTALPALGHGDKASKHKALLFHMLSLPKESSSQRTSAPQDANPLQQLQLFVARTVKSNEEELLMPCFPVLLAPGHPPAASKGQQEQKEESGDGENQAYRPAPGEGDVPVVGNAESVAAPAKEAVPFPGACRQLEPFSAMGSYGAKLSTFVGPELQNNVAELQHLANEDEEANDINIRADGAPREQNDLSPLRNAAVTPPPGQGKKADRLVEEQERKDKNKAALAFKTHEQSRLSCGLMEKETLGSATSAGLGTNEAERRAWCRGADRDEQAPGSVGTGSAPASPTSTLSPSNEPHTHPRLLQDTKINAKLPREGNGKKKSPNGCHYAGESLASLPSPMGFPHPKYLQSGGTEGGESPGFGSQLSEENKYSRSPLNASSSFLVTRCPPEADGNHTHHPTPSPTEQGTWNRTPAFPPLLHHCGATPTEAGGDGHHQSPEGVLGSYGQPEREGMARACAPLRADALVGSAVEVDGAQEPCRKDGSPPCSPFSHKRGGKEGPESAGAVLPGSHFRENQACTITDVVINSTPLETQNYPTQPTTDLVFTEREVNLNREKKLENCCDDGNKHRNEPEALSNGFVVQQVPAAVCRGLKRTGDLGPAESNGHQPSEAAEVRTGDLSKTTEIREKSLKGEKPTSHRAEHSGEAASCVLNNMGQGEGNTSHSTPSPSQNELQKEKKPNGLQVTCDICSASFRSKPGLTRHKAVKHQVKPGRTPRSALIPADETSRAAQKVPRRSLKAVREKTCGSQVPNAAEHAPKKMCTGLEKEPSAQMQEVVSRVLSDLSVISLEVSQELHRTRVAHREMKAKGQRAETGAGEDPGRQGRKGEKGRRSQSKDPGGVNGNSEKKLNRKVRRRKAKAFPSRHEPDGPCELGKSSGPAPAALSPSLPAVTEGLREPGGCISTEEQNLPNSSPPKAKQSPCAAELAEDLGDRVVPSEEVSKEPGTGTAPCPEGGEEPGEAESTQACRAWVGGFVKQVEEGLGEVGEEQHRGGTEEMEAETGGSSGGNGAGKWSSAPGGVTSPSPGVPNVQTNDLETPQKAPTHGALQPPPAASPAPAEPKRWAKAELTPSREHHGDNAATSDLQGLFDDDPTFSQLFPRDEQLIRRKCTRVYGKRSKKPKPVAEVSLRPAGAIDLFSIRLASDLSDTGSFCVTREDPCEYETISIDDALMLNMCHGSKARSGEAGPGGAASTALRSDGEKASPGRDVTDLEDNVLTFLCQNSHMDNGPSLSIWAGLEKEGESLAAEGMFEAPVGLENEHSLGETSSEPPDLAEEPYDGKSSEDSDSPEFHTIDIEMLNAKLKMRDVCFFGSCEELPGSGDDGASSFKPKPGQHSKHGRSKQEDGKLGKNRGDITIKAKDKQYKCKVCFQWFLTLGELDFHKLTHNPSPPPTCYMCVQRKFSSREQLRDHLKEKHAKNKAGLWACGMCLKEISDVWMYNEHLREHATQFARKGQAQKSVMGLPACFGEDNDAVTQFLNTIMCRKPSRSSWHAEPSSKHTPSRESRSPRELPPEQEVKAVKEPSESSSVKVKPPAPSSSKASASPSPEHPAKSEGTPKSVPMHPDCKDPSRDCHHCGKQFPKPFKLQRHLVVHSLQKIYLCHKCPMFYQETKELRNHLSQEHGIVEEQEIKHTTLYACELCADVMHVIKKSFICSMCNYTFSKKEQYDRHMEKHLAGSNRTFKFRGVMRPGAASKEGREKVREDGVPPSKKRKVAPHGTSADRLGHAGDLQLVDPASPSLQPPSEPFPGAPREPAAPQPQPPVKTEDLVGDFSDLLAEMEKSQFDTLPPPPCLSPSLPQAAAGSAELGHIAALSIEELEKGAFDGKPLPFLDSPGFSIDLSGLACSQATDQKLSPPHLTEKRGYADAHKKTSASNKDEYLAGGLENPDAATDAVDGIPFLQLAKKVSELPSQGAEAPPAKETHRTQWGNPSASEASCWEGASKATSPEAAHQPLPLKDKTASPALNRAAKDSASQKKNTGNQPGGEAAPEEGQQGSVPKDKSAPDGGTKESSAGTRDHGGNPSRSSGHQPRGDSAGHTAKLHPKRRKEHKSLSHRGSAGSRENMEGDGKKKKGRAPGPGRSESSGELKRADWSIAETPALSPGRRDAHGNRLLPKPKMGTQLKKMVLDACNQKKGELRHANGDVRRRKAILGKSLHQVLAKGTAPAPRGSLHGSRPARGTKPTGSASYRTAESQNNLLSQLFGQKLTSFKIPLRRETSE